MICKPAEAELFQRMCVWVAAKNAVKQFSKNWTLGFFKYLSLSQVGKMQFPKLNQSHLLYKVQIF